MNKKNAAEVIIVPLLWILFVVFLMVLAIRGESDGREYNLCSIQKEDTIVPVGVAAMPCGRCGNMPDISFMGVAYPTLIKAICSTCSNTIVVMARPGPEAPKEFDVCADVISPRNNIQHVEFFSLCNCCSCGTSIWVSSTTLFHYIESLNHDDTFATLPKGDIDDLKFALLCNKCKGSAMQNDVGDDFSYRKPIPHELNHVSDILPLQAYASLFETKDPVGLESSRKNLSLRKGQQGTIIGVAFLGWRQVVFTDTDFTTFVHVTEIRRTRKENTR